MLLAGGAGGGTSGCPPTIQPKSPGSTRHDLGRLVAEPADQRVTLMLEAASRGDESAAAELLPLVYEELRRLARSWMARRGPGQTLQPTALVHEAYLRLLGGKPPGSDWESRRHFFFAASRAMRDILVEQARRKASIKRGGGRRRVDAEHAEPAFEEPVTDMLALDEALKRLERDDSRKYRIVLLRFFGGLSARETAGIMDISLRTVEREWRYIRARLYQELAAAEPEPAGGTDV
jgi:RNA polymerase sigma factor (TIGR02999 family)